MVIGTRQQEEIVSMSASAAEHTGGPSVASIWIIRAVVVAALAAVIMAGVLIGRAATESHGVRRPSTAVSPAERQVVPSRPDLQGYLHLPKGMDGP
jgi:hypothetical protein